MQHNGSIFNQFSCSVMSDSLWPHGLQQARHTCPSPTPRACSHSCPLSLWCHPTISSSVIPLFLLPSIFPSIRVFSNESVLCIRWPSFGASALASVLPMNTQDWSPLGLTGWISSQESSPTPQFKSINSLASLLYGPTPTSIHGYWKNHSFD